MQIFALSNFALAQPVFDRLGRNPMYLTSEEFQPATLLILAAIVSVLIPGLIVLCQRVIAWTLPRLAQSFHTLCLFVGFLLIALPLVKSAGCFPGLLHVLISLALAVTATWLSTERDWFRRIALPAAAASLIFPGLFVFRSAATVIVFPRQAEPLTVVVERPVPIVMIVLDECSGLSLMTPDHTIDATRFPHFARLAAGSHWFRNSTSVHPDTLQAVPALLAGRFPDSPEVPASQTRPQNLFSLLEASNQFRITAFEPVSKLATAPFATRAAARRPVHEQLPRLGQTLWPLYLHDLSPTDYAWHLPRVPTCWFGPLNPTAEVVDRQVRQGVVRYSWGSQRDVQLDHFLDCLDESTQPSLHFLHVLLPHVPWTYLPSGRAYLSDDYGEFLASEPSHGNADGFGGDEWLVVQRQQRYLLQLQFVDRFIGRLLDRLQTTGLYDDCLLVVTADHGVAFQAAGPRRDLSPQTAPEILSTPLFIKRPGQTTGVISDRNVQSIDILPTIADVLGMRLPLPVDGVSVFATDHQAPPTKRSLDRQFQEFTFARDLVHSSVVPQQTAQRFGNSPDFQPVLKVGTCDDLLGQSLDAIPQTTDGAVTIELAHFQHQLEYAADSLVPCFFRGVVQKPIALERPVILAIAVNGTIRALTRTYHVQGLYNYWEALVPESSLRPGDNDIQFFSVKPTTQGCQLCRCQFAPPSEAH
ncbi:MAG: sulfatase-like hydrolase/transferase [Planctomycetes bacterium]|nr:sulfatase-like hydrolase/transferase [Planctomycetota bacterium]